MSTQDLDSPDTRKPIDLAFIADKMRSAGTDVVGTLRADPLGSGHSNLTFTIRDDRDTRWVARRAPLGSHLPSAHDVVREYRIMDALRGTQVPVPGTVGCFADHPEAPVIVVDHISGTTIDSVSDARSLPGATRAAIGPALVTALRAVHDVDLGETGLSDLASHAPYAPRQIKRWAGQWKAGHRKDIADLDKLTTLLVDRTPDRSDTRLVHGDTHLRNIVFDTVGNTLAALIDWELSTLGDPLADVGTLLTYWPQADDEPTGLFDASALPGFSTRDQLIDQYASLTGRDDRTVHYWHVLGLWKVAIIAEGVHMRALSSNKPTELHPEIVERLIARAWRVARAAGLG